MCRKKKHLAVVQKADCVACGTCTDVCPRGAITIWRGSFAVVDAALCVGCGRCAKECPASVIQLEVGA
ncbi:4Fe-4S dicluster domain-containing protein [Selenomonas sp. GACV-9]|uniref:4Fe-4S binding protein n=1 Tax=Selenomonas sp. GACV-9 TaxID=3158782 RepID=UPI0008F01472|nr:4Fe-4S dicluster domain-containing protein [Selenomonas ruminantium]